MSKLEVRRIRSPSEPTPSIFAEFEAAAERIRKRAHALFRDRKIGGTRALDDWLNAEREFAVPDAELKETARGYRISVALAGFDSDDISVTATPRTVILKASRAASEDDAEDEKQGKIRWSTFRSEDVYRRIDLTENIDVNSVKAKLKRGMLRIKARKAKE